jgi:hypothetical protein
MNQSTNQLWENDQWTYFILRPWVSLPTTVVFIIVCVMYATLREPSRTWESVSPNWRTRVWKPPSLCGTIWFTIELLLCSITAVCIVGEVVRLFMGLYSSKDWTLSDGIGTYLWLARVEVFFALMGCTWDFYRFAHLHVVELIYLASHIWLTGTWLSCPLTHSTASVVIPFAFVIDRAIFAAYRIQVERGIEQPVDLLRGLDGASHAGKALLHSRRCMRLFFMFSGTPLFFWHELKGNHHVDSHLHGLTTLVYLIVVLLFEIFTQQPPPTSSTPVYSLPVDAIPNLLSHPLTTNEDESNTENSEPEAGAEPKRDLKVDTGLASGLKRRRRVSL